MGFGNGWEWMEIRVRAFARLSNTMSETQTGDVQTPSCKILVSGMRPANVLPEQANKVVRNWLQN
jgi:acetolactate synthase regulatory subunit